MKIEGDDALRNQRASGKARAMTRAINMVSEEFIENFAQTGKDDGPEAPPKLSPVREALAARERRESAEAQKTQEKPEFRGFAALMANANGPAKVSAFARLLEDDNEPATTAPMASPQAAPQTLFGVPQPGAAQGHPAGPETTADGAIIKVKDTVGKKRGLYTSCMQRPTAEQMQEAAVNFSRATGKPITNQSPSPTPLEAAPAPAPAADTRPQPPSFSSGAAPNSFAPSSAGPSNAPSPSSSPSPFSRPAQTEARPEIEAQPQAQAKPIAASPFARPSGIEPSHLAQTSGVAPVETPSALTARPPENAAQPRHLQQQTRQLAKIHDDRRRQHLSDSVRLHKIGRLGRQHGYLVQRQIAKMSSEAGEIPAANNQGIIGLLRIVQITAICTIVLCLLAWFVVMPASNHSLPPMINFMALALAAFAAANTILLEYLIRKRLNR